MNRIRLARRNFEREVWEDWCWRHRTYYGPKVWSAAWRLFERNRESVEADREYFLRVRPHSVYQYAAQFDLAWPLTLAEFPLSPARGTQVAPVSDSLPGERRARLGPDRVLLSPRDQRGAGLRGIHASTGGTSERRTSRRSRRARRRTSRRSRPSEPPDFAAFTTSEPPDFAAFTTSEPPDFAAFTTSERAGLRGPGSAGRARCRTSRRSRRARVPDFAAFTTREAPDFAAFSTSEPPDSGPGSVGE